MPTNPVRKTLVKLLAGAAGMFLFAIFLMPPLYDVFCDITGIGGKTGGPYQVSESGVDMSRTVKVQFVATNNGAMPWEFTPKVFEVTVHPGEPTEAAFFAKNRTSRDMVAQAIPNVTPFNAAEYFFLLQPATARSGCGSRFTTGIYRGSRSANGSQDDNVVLHII